jgi:hypothetical protein
MAFAGRRVGLATVSHSNELGSYEDVYYIAGEE